jgi:hypothetical protein
MPIRPELRHFYRGPGWRAARKRILARAGGTFDAGGKYNGDANCENCGARDRSMGYFHRDRFVMCDTRKMLLLHRISVPDLKLSQIQIGCAHKNHRAGDDRDENLAGWCRRCHLLYDQDHHAFTRATRKDAAWPLLVVASARSIA